MSADDRERPEVDGLDELIEGVIEQSRPKPSAEQQREEWQRVMEEMREMRGDMPPEALALLEAQEIEGQAGGLLLRRALEQSGILDSDEDIAAIGTRWGSAMLQVCDLIKADQSSTANVRFEALDQMFDIVLLPMIRAIDRVSHSIRDAETIAAVEEQETDS